MLEYTYLQLTIPEPFYLEPLPAEPDNEEELRFIIIDIFPEKDDKYDIG